MLITWIRNTLEKRKIERKRRIVIESGLFDPNFYIVKYSDVAEAGWPPLDHYVRYGADENRQPSAKFDPEQYLKQNPDLAATKIPAFWHLVDSAISDLPRRASPEVISLMAELRSLKVQILQYGADSLDLVSSQSRVSSDLLALSRRQSHIETLTDKIAELDKRTAEILKRIEMLESSIRDIPHSN